MKISCIDFETANSSRGSACSVGVAVIRDGIIQETEERFIKPHRTCSYFDPFNVGIHGIRSRDVAKSPEFDKLAPWLFDVLNADLVVAHNAAFDISVLRAVCDLYHMPYPCFDYFCTYKAASRFWSHLENHKLNTVCEYIGHEFEHHNAKSDAEAAGAVLLKMLKESGADSPEAFAVQIDLQLGLLMTDNYRPCSCKKVKEQIKR